MKSQRIKQTPIKKMKNAMDKNSGLVLICAAEAEAQHSKVFSSLALDLVCQIALSFFTSNVFPFRHSGGVSNWLRPRKAICAQALESLFSSELTVSLDPRSGNRAGWENFHFQRFQRIYQ